MSSDADHPRLSVVIPIKDERDNLVILTQQLLDVFRATPLREGLEILFVDDGSSDGSSELLDELAAQHHEVTVLHFDHNYGQTSAFAAGFGHAAGDLIVTMDGDLQLDPKDILLLLPLSADYDVVCGWRKDRHDTVVRRVSSWVANGVRRTLTGDGVHDTGCSLKIFRRSVVERLVLFEGMHRFFPALALMHGFTVAEVPVRHYPRRYGVSKYGVGNRLFRGVYDLFAVRWMQSRCLRYRVNAEKPTLQSWHSDDRATEALNEPVHV